MAALFFLAISLVELATAPSDRPLFDLFVTFGLQAGVGGLVGIIAAATTLGNGLSSIFSAIGGRLSTEAAGV